MNRSARHSKTKRASLKSIQDAGMLPVMNALSGF